MGVPHVGVPHVGVPHVDKELLLSQLQEDDGSKCVAQSVLVCIGCGQGVCECMCVCVCVCVCVCMCVVCPLLIYIYVYTDTATLRNYARFLSAKMQQRAHAEEACWIAVATGKA